MANEWLKVELVTPDKPEVFQIAQALNLDPEAVFTKLFRVWAWFDQHSENGNAPVTLLALLDSRANVTGFGKAMADAGWLEISDTHIRLPNFDRHVGNSAKKRALTARRAAEHRKRNGKSNALSVTKDVTECVTKCVTQNKNKNIKEAPVGAMDEKEQKLEFWNTGLPLLTEQGMPEKQARTFLGKVVATVGFPDALEIMRLAKHSGDAAAYLAKAGFAIQLPTNNRELFEIRVKLGLPMEYENQAQCHEEIRQRLRAKPELRQVVGL